MVASASVQGEMRADVHQRAVGRGLGGDVVSMVPLVRRSVIEGRTADALLLLDDLARRCDPSTEGDRGHVDGALAALTPQQLAVARCAARGLTNQEVALEVQVSLKTVESYLTHVYRKLAVRSRTEMANLLRGP
jgi:DNA-binding NarL/FixJ family response regulator